MPDIAAIERELAEKRAALRTLETSFAGIPQAEPNDNATYIRLVVFVVACVLGFAAVTAYDTAYPKVEMRMRPDC